MEHAFILLLIIIAFLYASIGHGGASGYLGLMALFSVEPLLMRPSALILNLFVAGIAFISYYRGGYFRSRILLPFIITSTPFAFAGASVNIDPQVYKIILGVLLCFAVLRMLVLKPKEKSVFKDPPILPALLIGALLGFFSGMIGIGGGIILSPVLILLGWASVKQAAAVSALFIFLNSAAGLMGTSLAGLTPDPQIYYWVVAGLFGGFLGSFAGSFKISSIKLQYILALVLVMASMKLFLY
jgi:uncharacterized membrane protein YfcA